MEARGSPVSGEKGKPPADTEVGTGSPPAAGGVNGMETLWEGLGPRGLCCLLRTGAGGSCGRFSLPQKTWEGGGCYPEKVPAASGTHLQQGTPSCVEVLKECKPSPSCPRKGRVRKVQEDGKH